MMKTTPPTHVDQRDSRAQAVDAVDVLNDLVGDYITATNVLREYQILHNNGKLPTALMVGIQRMCMSHVVLACCKFIEFHERFHVLLTSEQRTTSKTLIAEFRRCGIPAFRNKAIGHIWDNDKNRPLYLSEIEHFLAKITAGDMPGFLEWVNRLQREPQAPDSVCGIADRFRTELIASHAISESAVMRR